jgi:uncharacterized protein (DUF342 family)
MDEHYLLSRKFGIIAVKKGFATRDEIDKALNEQKRASVKGEPCIHIADILVDSGVITNEQKEEALLSQKSRKEKISVESERERVSEDALEIREKDIGFSLTVSKDRTEAHICLSNEEVSDTTLESIKGLLEKEGIKYGIVDDARITEYLATKPSHKEKWEIAAGKAAKAGQDWKIECCFDPSLSKNDTVNKGVVDGEERMESLQVKKGDTIAKKVPGSEGIPGVDVYGQPIPPPNPKDIALRIGKGTEISEDGLKIIAQADGRPEISEDGKICVFPYLKISNDVGLETGHIEFDGHIEIQGTIPNGVRVRGKSLRADEILKADIDIAGDIVVQRGVIGARVRTIGNFKANHIHKADIEALGDIVIETEAIESNIETNGRFIIDKGKIRSSVVVAKKGINALEIGSYTSSPCTLNIGIDSWVRKQIKNINGQIATKEKEGKRLKSLDDELQQEFDRVGEEIEEKAQEEAPIMAQQVALKNKKQELQDVDEPELLAKTEDAIKQLDIELSQINETVERLFDKQGQIEEKIAGNQNDIVDSEKQVEELHNKIKRLTESMEADKGIPIIRVFGTTFAKTVIQGLHSELTLKENCSHVRIRESRVKELESPNEWKMNISPIK